MLGVAKHIILGARHDLEGIGVDWSCRYAM